MTRKLQIPCDLSLMFSNNTCNIQFCYILINIIVFIGHVLFLTFIFAIINNDSKLCCIFAINSISYD